MDETFPCSAQIFEMVCNHPKVRPWLGGDDYLKKPDNMVCLRNGLCVGMFHEIYNGIWMAHQACHPDVWGKSVEPMMKILDTFDQMHVPQRVVGWTPENNRMALSFAKKIGFKVDGLMPLPSGNLVIMGWSKCQLV